MKTARWIGRSPQVRAVVLAALAFAVLSAPATAQQSNSRFLAKEDIFLYGVGLKVEPASQTVPRDIATIVSTFLQAPNDPEVSLPPFAPNAVVRATLRGPSFATPIELTAAPNSPFNIPPLPVAGLHTLDDIRLVSNGEVLLRGVPESASINVIKELLVTQVTARPLSATEIREQGIVFDKDNFQAYNFTAAFAVQGTTIDLSFPVLLPRLADVQAVAFNRESLPTIAAPALQTLRTIIPDTLKIQTQVPNLSVVGFSLKVAGLEGEDLIVPAIPGVIVFPGNIGFLNQFFSVLLMVSNVAPEGSSLVVSDLRASIVLPPGRDSVVNTPDDPLAMARTAAGETPRIKAVTQPGADGQLGTADDVLTLGPGQTGNAEYLVEGRREGSQVVEMELEGTLHGLPVGPVTIRGRAAGAVLVKNPTYTLTFIHPETVSAGEPYTLDITVTNTSESPANFVSVNLLARNISGATLIGEPTREVESIPPGDSATVTFDLISRVTGNVTAATLDSDEQIAGRFELKHAVGELGVPLSPESLVLPKEASALPKSLRDATLGLLGKAWAVATSPAAALPRDVKRFSRQMVLDMAVATAEAGLRVTLTEPLRDSSAHLALDMFGSLFNRLPELNPKPGDLEFAQNNYLGFDDLRRKSIRGEVFAQAVADLLHPDLTSLGVTAFHRDLAKKTSYRPPQISVLAGSGGNPLPLTIVIVDEEGRRLGGVNPQGRIVKEIPFADLLRFKSSGHVTAEMAFLVAPPEGEYTIRLEPVSGADMDVPFSLSIATSRADGSVRHVSFENITLDSLPNVSAAAADLFHVSVVGDEDAAPVTPTSDTVLDDPEPWILSVVQRAEADRICNASGPMVGRIVAVLFSEDVTPGSVQDKFKSEDITNFLPEANRVVSVALQPGRRIAYLALRDSYGPFIPRQISISGVADTRGHIMQPQTLAMVATIPPDGAVVSGRVLNADGTPIPFANIRLFNGCPPSGWVGISSKNADEQGRYSWDFVVEPYGKKIIAIDPDTEEFRDVQFNVQRQGQRLNVDVVMLGRGTFSGRTLSEAGVPLRNTNLRVTSQTDNSQYGAITDASGAFAIPRIPVGNILVEAVNTTQKARTFLSETIPFAGATTTRDIVLLNVETTQTTIKRGNIKGHVLRADNSTPVEGVPVILYYESLSQPGVVCAPTYCPIALVNTDAAGAFSFAGVTAGRLRVETFDQASYQKGEIAFTLAENATIEANVILTAGLGVVRGIVVGPEGKPVVGARVGGGLSLTTTDLNGQFTLTDVPVGRTDIVAVSDALGTRGVATIDISRAGEEVNARIDLEGRGGVAGIVRSSTGQPLANITVYLFRSLGNGGIQVVGSAITDAQGGYSIGGVPLHDDYTASAFRSDFSDGNIAKTAVHFNGQVAKRDVTFRGGGGTVRGRLLDDDGVTPLRGRVGLSGDQLKIAGGRVGVGFQHVANFKVVDSNLTTGAFAMGGVWVGRFTLSAVGQFSPDPVSLENTMPSAGATVDMDIRLQPTSQVTGRVFRPDGVTPVGANLIVTYKSDEFRSICSEDASGELRCESIPQGIQEEIVVTDADGRFGLPLVNAGTFTVTVEDPVTGLMGRTKGSVKAGEVIDIDVRLIGRGQITIKVRGSDTTTPIPGARVQIKQLDFPNKSFTALADTQGVLVVAGGDAFTEGPYVVIATDLRNGFAGRASGVITQDGQQVSTTVFLYNQRGVVYGSVFKSDGITPVANAEVVVSNDLGSLALTVTDASGTYRVEQIPLGTFSIDVFEASTARRGFATGQIFTDGQEVPVNITEAALGVVRGTVLEAGSLSPLKAWRVRLTQTAPNGRGLPSLAAMSSVDGTFSFPGVSQGAVTLSALHDTVRGSGSANAAITREGQVVEVPLLATIVRPLFGGVQGRVVTPDGAPAPNSVVTVCLGSCAHPSAPRAVTGADGEFLIENVPLGRQEVRAVAQGSANAGTAFADIAFDGQIAGIVIPLVGLTEVTGQVVNGDGSPAAFAQVVLEAIPASGCLDVCNKFADGNGNFSFSNLPARRVTIRAANAAGLKGVVGEVVNPGEVRNVRIVLEPTGRVRGRALRQNLSPAAGVVADLVINNRHVFTQTGSDGTFEFPTTPVGIFTLTLEDAVTSGIATRTGTVIDAIELGDVRLDESSPAVASTTPALAATAVPLNATVRVVFSEPVNAGTITALNVSLSDDEGVIPATLSLGTGDTAVTLTPLSPLSEFTRYSIRVQGVKDVVGKPMSAAYVASFTTVDLTPPTHLDVSPAAGTNGVPVLTAIRVKFSEPIDPTKFTTPFFMITGPTGAVAGQIDYAFGNTVVIFTPTFPLAEDAVYRVQAPAATDIAGNAQALGLDYTFATTDRTPPQIVQLKAPATVIENSVASVIADVGVTHDVGFVDFFVNGVFVAVARSTPFTLQFQAIASLGSVGDHITVSAIATDTSGNRGQPSAPASLLITPDQPPVVTITAPPAGFTAKNGDRIVVNVRAVDDLGVTQQGYKAQTGLPQDTALRTIAPASVDRTESFAFHVPGTAAPGSTILVEASAADTKGQIAQAAPIAITVLDSVAPVVAITGASTGNGVRPGQQTTVIVSAQDLGGVTDISFSTTGVTATSDARTLAPPQNSALASFTFQVPAFAQPGDSITLRATAKDRAGNVGTAANVILPVVDTVAPSAQLRTATGSLTIAPGGTINVVVDATDGIGVSRVELAGSGAFSFSDAKQVNPPSGDAHVTFSIAVPATLQPGDVLNLQARAIDLANNVSAPAFLSLVTRAFAEVVLPPSVILNAGRFVDVSVQLTGGAPAGGQLVTFTTAKPNVATTTASVLFAAGETARTIRVNGVSGGTTQLSAFVQGVERAAMTITVQGGVVEGVVLDSTLSPVVGAQVTVSGGALPLSAVTDAQGRYLVIGVSGDSVTVRAIDPVTEHRGVTIASMSQANGFANVDVVLIAAGSIRGTVKQADAETPAGAGVRVDLFASNNFSIPVATTFTDDSGEYDFDVVPLGVYRVDATATNGNRGRSNANLNASGDELEIDVVYLGRGSVFGIVRDGAGQAAGNAVLTFSNTSVLGSSTITRNANADGTFRFDGVFVGNFSLKAVDPETQQAAFQSGTLTFDGETLERNLTLSTYGSIEGTVFRFDGVTPVAGASVQVGGVVGTTTDSAGRYEFPIVPLGNFTVTARESSTRGIGSVSGTLSTNGERVTRNVTFVGQGTVVGLVTDANGVAQQGAFFLVEATHAAGFKDTISGFTGADGRVILPHVLAGTLTFTATKNPLSGTAPPRTLAPGEVLEVTVQLQATASIVGTVLAPDGQTPQTTGSVAVGVWNAPSFSAQKTVPIASDGTFRIDGITLGTYNLAAYDTGNRLRALIKTPIVLSANGDVATRQLTFVGLGTVTGRVVNPNGTSAPNFVVQVRSLTPDFGRVVNATSNAGGVYTANNVVVGEIMATTGNVSQGLLGESFGTLATHAGTLTLDVLLKSNAINLPASRFDGNAFRFDVQPNGSVLSPSASVFAGNDAQGGARLEIIRDGETLPFTGSAIGTVEDQSREIAARQNALGGLNITRKVFVPVQGYFARYLEMLTNPTADPITVDVRISSHLRAGQTNLVRETSSGDAVLDVSDSSTADRWLVVDDADQDPFTAPFQHPSLAFTFDGPDAAARASSAALTTTSVCQPFCTHTDHVTYQWSSVTVPPGGMVALMHFVTQQTSRASATASAERLVQLPPEALSGLSAEEIAAVRNFAVPGEGQSALAPLSLSGTITGRLLEYDGTTLSPASQVTFKSSHPIFTRTYTSFAANGQFSLTSNFSGDGNHRVVPVHDFTVSTRHGLTQVFSPTVNGTFPADELTTVADIVFSNTGMLTGRLLRAGGQPVASTSVRMTDASGLSAAVVTGSDGRFTFRGVPAGLKTMSATVFIPPNANLATQGTVTTNVGQTGQFDLLFPPTGGVTGIVRSAAGAPAVNLQVRLMAGSTTARTVTTDTSGRFTMLDVATGSYTLQATEPTTQVVTTVNVSIVADTTITQDLTLNGIGTIAGTVTLASGAVASGSLVQLYVSSTGTVQATQTTNASGAFTFANRPVGQSYRVRAFHPVQTTQFKETTNQLLASHGQTLTLNVTLPAQATVRVTVRRPDGTGFANARVQIRDAFSTTFREAGNANASGVLLIANVPEGAFTVQALDPTTGVLLSAASGSVAFANNGQTLDISINVGLPLPTNLFDGNASRFDVQRDGSLFDGQSDAFNNGVVLHLSLPNDGFISFTGAPLAGVEENGREIVVSQANLLGLDVQRKVYVPTDGYFARYLERLHNPGTAPIVVNVLVNSNLGGVDQSRVLASSSGDQTYAAQDLWVVTDDDAVATQNGDPTLAFVVGGPGAPRTLSSASLAPLGSMRTEWQNVTVAPGETIVLMHFAVQQPQMADVGATTAAQRLVQLPPEALEGLTTDERAAIVNWVVPADGSSPLEPIAARTGQVSGVTLAGDGATPLGAAVVTYTNANYPYLNASLRTVTSATNGTFSFTGAFLEPFTLQGRTQVTSVLSPLVNATFASGQTSVTQNVVFSNTGIVRGRVLRGTTPVASFGIGLDNFGSFVAFSNFLGEYVVTGVLPGAHTLTALNGAITGSVSVNVVAGQVTTADIIVGAGTISGRVTRTNGAGPGVSLVTLLNADGTTYSSTFSDAQGFYAFPNLPLNRPFLVRSQFPGVPASVTTTTMPAVITADLQVVTVNLTLRPFASLRVTALQADNVTPIVGATITLSRDGAAFQPAGSTNTFGFLLITNVVASTFAVRASDSAGTIGEVSGSIGAADDGTTIEVPITSTGVGGEVKGTLFAADGVTPLPQLGFGYVDVELLDASQNVLDTAFADGNYSMTASMPAGTSFTVRAHPPAPLDYSDVTEVTGEFTRRGDVVTRDVSLSVGVVSGTVHFYEGGTVAFPNVILTRAGDFFTEALFATRVDDQGGFGIVVRAAGDYLLTVQDPQSGLSTTVPVSVTDPTQVTDVGVVALPQAISVFGNVVDYLGVPVANATVGLSSSAGSDLLFTAVTDENGSFGFFNGMPAAPYTVQACAGNGDQERCGVATTSYSNVDVVLSGPGEVTGNVFASDGFTAVQGAEVTLHLLDAEGPLRPSPRRQQTSPNGAFVFADAPTGAVVVTARDPQSGEFGMADESVLPSPHSTNMSVYLGNGGLSFDNGQINQDDGGFRVDVLCTGQLGGAGSSTGPGSVSNGQTLVIGRDDFGGSEFPCRPYARGDVRQLTLEGSRGDRSALRVSREIYTVFGGEFTRYLEVLENPLDVDVTVRVRIVGAFTTFNPIVTNQLDTGAFVMDGSGVNTGVGFVYKSAHDNVVSANVALNGRNYSYEWVVTIPAGETRRVLHYFVQAPAGVFMSNLVSQLVNPALVDWALAGLSPEELASIVNFVFEQ